MLDAAMAREVEDRLLAEASGVQIARVHHHSSSSLRVSATISPSGLMIMLHPNMGCPSSMPALATATTHVEFW